MSLNNNQNLLDKEIILLDLLRPLMEAIVKKLLENLIINLTIQFKNTHINNIKSFLVKI